MCSEADNSIHCSGQNIESDIILKSFDEFTNVDNDEDEIIAARSKAWLKMMETGKLIR